VIIAIGALVSLVVVGGLIRIDGFLSSILDPRAVFVGSKVFPRESASLSPFISPVCCPFYLGAVLKSVFPCLLLLVLCIRCSLLVCLCYSAGLDRLYSILAQLSQVVKCFPVFILHSAVFLRPVRSISLQQLAVCSPSLASIPLVV